MTKQFTLLREGEEKEGQRMHIVLKTERDIYRHEKETDLICVKTKKKRSPAQVSEPKSGWRRCIQRGRQVL